MREIKFRGLDNQGVWHYGNLFQDIKPNYKFTYILANGFVPANSMPNRNFREVIPETVGQFTGLTDKNGKCGYKGDILIDTLGNRGVIVWNQDDCSFSVNSIGTDLLESLYEDDMKKFEIIGNIHEPEKS